MIDASGVTVARQSRERSSGGDSITATTKYGQTEHIDYICTGGGALIRFLTGEELPVVKALRHGATVEEKK